MSETLSTRQAKTSRSQCSQCEMTCHRDLLWPTDLLTENEAGFRQLICLYCERDLRRFVPDHERPRPEYATLRDVMQTMARYKASINDMDEMTSLKLIEEARHNRAVMSAADLKFGMAHSPGLMLHALCGVRTETREDDVVPDILMRCCQPKRCGHWRRPEGRLCWRRLHSLTFRTHEAIENARAVVSRV